MPEHKGGIVQIYSEKKPADNRFKSLQPWVNGNCTGAVSSTWSHSVSAADKTDWPQGPTRQLQKLGLLLPLGLLLSDCRFRRR